MYNKLKYNNTTFADILKHLQNSFATINNNLYEYKKLSYLLHKDEKSNINIFLHNLLYKYWNIFNFTSLSIATILSFLLKLLYKKAEKYTKSKLPPKFQEIIFTNLFNKINLTKFLLNKIKNIINNIKNKIIIYKTKLANKQPKDKQRIIKIELDINIDFIKNITKNFTKITKEIINITLSFINISSATKETQIKTKPIKYLAILFVGKQKLPDKENEIYPKIESKKCCLNHLIQQKSENEIKPIIFNNKEEKINKKYQKNENYKNEIFLKDLENSTKEMDFINKKDNNVCQKLTNIKTNEKQNKKIEKEEKMEGVKSKEMFNIEKQNTKNSNIVISEYDVIEELEKIKIKNDINLHNKSDYDILKECEIEEYSNTEYKNKLKYNEIVLQQTNETTPTR